MTLLRIEPLGKHHTRANFSSGRPELDRYIQEIAGQDMKKKAAVTYVLTAVSDTKIIGYYTLSASSVPLDDFPNEVAKKLSKYPDVPVSLIGRLAVDIKHRGGGYGKKLLMDALRVSYENSFRVASTAVIVDTKDGTSAAFYTKFGFIPFTAKVQRLFLSMKTIERLVTSLSSVPK